MDFAFTPEQTAFRMELRAWLRDNLPAGWGGTFQGPEDPHENAEFRRAWDRKIYEAGYNAVHWPKEYGGRELSIFHTLIVSEELGRVAAPEPFNTAGTETAGPLLMGAGTDAQKARFLPRIAAVEDIWCQGFTEPEAGSDLSSLKTRAVRDGDAWVIEGRKIWTSHAREADWCVLLARTDPDARTSGALTVFAVPMHTPGIEVRPLRQITGRADFNEILFDNARIPADSPIGAVNDGWRVANQSVARERTLIRLYRQARFQNEFEHVFRAAMTRRRGAGVVADDADFQQQAAEIFAMLRIFRIQNLRLLSRLEAGETVGAEASFLRLLWTEARQKIGQLGLDVLGEDAVLNDGETCGEGRFQDVYFSSRADTIVAGTAQIQRNIVAERILGLPR
ncbi:MULTISPECIES: acyl-CoA dehydrogenase family protein [unclassified Sphingobium]|uniref:acyl-CoA dehydrogenase family protein n=1 Tax=unclassified Sphingobium TaxID=2611147 RepID=UPI00119C0EC4|nr:MULTISPECIES: acyl-CoA dehydrogenase family protein [unclassified Sphingobium]MBG6119998.1 alkylation response protein AidB-like acyl-CoA dehydrogenase [Sphingobium sp. JAI105]TWD05800.1 alkylation response protein AidB-like acyl-CoA dehydrogenase [Sphingobium sp. AEW010]TWD23353.1 alkylation response protein AidB-like acyl-CoA dehydrogenase [Sphingobium sp. AEW013]TWD25213.1 alkylation response protein AidB-like acyl-CoA dehydrogenase [Sphingobium sp. AEW001]